MNVSDAQIVTIFAFIVAGYYIFWRIAQKNAIPWNFKSYFLGGAKLGGDLTENNTVGITFAWSGGTWYFAWLAYQFGPIVVATQLFWIVSLVGLALLFPKILPNVKNRTIHGFLRKEYGHSTQRLAAVATTFGYFINAGFELFWASLLFSRCLGREDMSLPVALVLAVFVGTYCAIGGYKSNALIDKAQNILGVVALAGLVLFVGGSFGVGNRFTAASYIFAGGSMIYVLLSLLNSGNRLARHRTLHDSAAIAFGCGALFVSLILLRAGTGSSAHTVLVNSPIPLTVLISTIAFQVFFNLIDMQNWQQIAANGDIPRSDYGAIRWAIVRGSLFLMWFPALGGALLGLALRLSPIAVNDGNIFSIAFSHVLPTGGSLVRGVVLGILFLGFISTSLSTVGDLLMSALQTICFDIVWPSKVEELLKDDAASVVEQRKLVLKARSFLIPLALAMVVAFFGLWKLYPGPVFYFQSVMYAMPLALLAPVLYALFYPKDSPSMASGALWGIGGSIIVVIVMFVVSVLPGIGESRSEWIVSLMPVAANAVSFLLFFTVPIMVTACRRLKRTQRM